MIDITNKQIRKELANHYLEAETSRAEEMLLADYYNNHQVDDDEVAIAHMIRIENIHSEILSDKRAEEFDTIIKKTQNKSTHLRFMYWISGIAATLVLFFSLNLLHSSNNSSDTIEVAQEIQQIMNLNTNEIMSISATPINGCVWFRVELIDGSTKTFIRTKESDKTSLLAII